MVFQSKRILSSFFCLYFFDFHKPFTIDFTYFSSYFYFLL
ncbi:MAG: hypothetical protein MRERV_6c001 [Mycoplasmataceae bacterium RV_VA103A]|nr:MAG: hypothetical protein MRERV_6c001 [Mycoplasmataceae bacterium RV_VA103A]